MIVPLSDDEYLTYREHVNKDLITILTNGNPDTFWSPNNHILNTLFVKASLGMFGLHDWAFRLHILAAFLVCFYFMYKIIAGFVPSPARTMAYLGILFLNPYLLDFFSIARGYGPSIAAWAATMYFTVKYFDRPTLRYLGWAMFSLFMATWANFSAIYFLPLFGAIFLFSFFQNKHDGNIRKHFLLLIGGASVLLAVIALPFSKVLDSKAIFVGSGSFYQDCIVSYVDYYMHYNEKMGRFDRVGPWSKMEVYGAILSAIWILLQAVSIAIPSGKKIRQLQYMALFQCAGILSIVLVLHAMMDVPYPYHRSVLLFTFPFILCFIISLELLVIRFKYFRFAVYALFAFCIWHCSHSWNFVNTMEWYRNGDAKLLFTYLDKALPEGYTGNIPTLGAEQWQYFSLAFYAETKYKDRIELKFTTLENHDIYDYLFVPKYMKDNVWPDYMPMQEFRYCILYKRKVDDGSAQ
mgnify:CR=1 FL=1